MSIELSPDNLFREDDFIGVKTVIAAVSGGSDSLGLMLLLHHHFRLKVDAPKLVAVTVDHGLRPESAQEALWVGAVCAHYGIAHEIVTWDEAKPLTALSEHARKARYERLVQVALHYDAPIIMTGHTKDDQAETYYMRLTRQSVRGLAAMPREALLMGSIRLLRPLLSVRRFMLRHYLEAHGQEWIDDPSNENDIYERVRMRKSLDDQAIDRAIEMVAKHRVLRQKQSQDVAKIIVRIKPRINGEMLEFSPLAQDILNHEELGFTFAVLAAVMGGASFLTPKSRLDALEAFCRTEVTSLSRFAFSGTVLEKRPEGWRMWRENRSFASREIAAGKVEIWDGRYEIKNHGDVPLIASVAGMQAVKNAIAESGLSDDTVHFPSLQTTLMLSAGGKGLVPLLLKGREFFPDVRISRVMNPFGWLVSRDDWAMFDVLKQIFIDTHDEREKN